MVEEEKPLPDFSTHNFDPSKEDFNPKLDLTSLFKVRAAAEAKKVNE
jgi:hypothetical protein